MTDGEYTATVDRIETDADGERLAVVLLEGEDGVEDQLVVSADELPEGARDGGGVLDVTVVDGELIEAEYRPEETERRLERARERFDRLSERPPGRDEDG